MSPAAAGQRLPGALLNTPEQIRRRLEAGRIAPLRVALMLPGRTVFALLTFGLVTLIALAAGASDPLGAARGWWMVSGTLIHVGCLIALARHEGITLFDLAASRYGMRPRVQHRGEPRSGRGHQLVFSAAVALAARRSPAHRTAFLSLLASRFPAFP
jgi:hypothetical protein